MADLDDYYFTDGCRALDSNCADGMYCGSQSSCTNCTITECASHARANKAYAFVYRSVKPDCRLCDIIEFKNRKTLRGYGIYQKGNPT